MDDYYARTDDLAGQIVELKGRLDLLRPLNREQMALLWPKFENDATYYTYATNAIEGSTLTQGETTNLLQYGVTVGGKPLVDHLDAINGRKAFVEMLRMVKERTRITEEVIMGLHRIAGEAGTENAGFYRNDQRYIDGSAHVPPAWYKVTGRMAELMEIYNDDIAAKKHPVVVAAKLHYGIGNIHPFADYNGRTSRLVMNLHLMQYGYIPITIDLQERPRYLEALEKSSKAGDALSGDPGRGNPAPFVLYIAEMERRVMERHVQILHENFRPPQKIENEQERGNTGRGR
jgi:Fic family protein